MLYFSWFFANRSRHKAASLIRGYVNLKKDKGCKLAAFTRLSIIIHLYLSRKMLMKLAYLVRETKKIYYPNENSYNEFNSYNQHNIIVRCFELFVWQRPIYCSRLSRFIRTSRKIKERTGAQPALSL